jgi:hypothetical protein
VFTDPTGWDGVKKYYIAENVYAPLMMVVSLGARERTLAGKRLYIRMDRLIPILTPLSSHWTVPLNNNFKVTYVRIFRAFLYLIN